MSFLPDDLESIQNATGLSELELLTHTALEDEYMRRLSMFHSLGGQGTLPPLGLIDMLRFLNFEPPLRIREVPQADWRQVRRNAKVLVTTDHGLFVGDYAGHLGTTLGVCFGDSPEQHEFEPACVVLAPSVLPAGVKTQWESGAKPTPVAELKVAQDRQSVAEAQRIAELGEDADVPPVNLEPKAQGPVVSVDWLRLAPGDLVECKMGRGKKRKVAKFVTEGPGDGKISVVLEGDSNVSVLEESNVVALEAAE